MDSIDIQLLHELAANANVTAAQLVTRLQLSIPAINKRIAKLKDAGLIRRYTILTDPKLVGKPLIAYIMVMLGRFTRAEELMRFVTEDPDILECYAVTGEYDFLLKICAADIESIEDKLLELKRRKGVAKSHTILTLLEHKFQPVALPDASKSEGS